MIRVECKLDGKTEQYKDTKWPTGLVGIPSLGDKVEGLLGEEMVLGEVTRYIHSTKETYDKALYRTEVHPCLKVYLKVLR